MSLTQAVSIALSTFLASFVEFVEALTIVLAVGTSRGWRPALYGATLGAGFLALLVASLGPALQRVPLPHLQLVIGFLLLLFGLRWLRKAILRSAGIIPFRNEDLVFRRESQALTGPARAHWSFLGDSLGIVTTFKAVVLEGLEVVFIVVATGSTAHALGPAIAGAVAAGLLVLLLGLAIHRPLARIPENTLKFSVGILLSAFGVFWLGEGLSLAWPGDDLALLGLVALIGLGARLRVRQLRQSHQQHRAV